MDGPYVGLSYYMQDNGAMFFGRDIERTVVIGNLRVSRLTLLYAPSGAGKSSLLRAGVASRLEELAQQNLKQRGTARNIPVVFVSWKDDPTVELIYEIRHAIVPFVRDLRDLPDEFSDGRLEEAIEAMSKAADATLLVMLDQFEEHFLYRSREAQNRRFADELAACVNRPDLRANFLISVRDDAYSDLGDLFDNSLANVYGNHLHLEYLNRESARVAIEKPIAKFNELHPDQAPIEIEPELVEAVLDQVGLGPFVADWSVGRNDDAIAAPYLQLVIWRLWQSELAQGSSRLRLQTLQELGGAQGILRTAVDVAIRTLTDDEREAAADILGYLVTPAGTRIALSDLDLAEYTGRSASEVGPLLDRLAGSDIRILRRVPAPPGQDPMRFRRYEIFHDLLAPAILDWRRSRRAGQQQRKRWRR